MIHIYSKISASKEDPETMGIKLMPLIPILQCDTPSPFWRSFLLHLLQHHCVLWQCSPVKQIGLNVNGRH